MAGALALLGTLVPAHAQDDSILLLDPIVGKADVEKAGVARYVEDRAHISIIEILGGYDRDLPDGTFNAGPRIDVAQEFFSAHADIYDGLLVFTSFEFDTDGAQAFHVGVRNDVEGIGIPVFDNSAAFGSAGRLHSYIDMAALTRYVTNPLDPAFDGVLGTAAHEMMHRWGIRLALDATDGTPGALLGQKDSHWSYLLDTDASLMYGSEWRDNGDGTFTAIATRKFYSPLDLYLAGIYRPEEVPPFLLIENPAIDQEQLPEANVTVTGQGRVVTIDEVIAANGPRVPAAADAQRDFRVALVLLVRPGETVDDAMIGGLENVRAALLDRFPILTGGRVTLEAFPEVSSDEDVGAPQPVDGGTIRDSQATFNDGLAWLRSRQTAQGFWEDRPATRLRDTTLALATLKSLDPTWAGDAAARSWLAGQSEANLDELARSAATLGSLGVNVSADRALLLDRQNADGGWGLAEGFVSNAMDTALAILALAGHADVPAPALDTAAGFLLASVSSDGAWSYSVGGASRAGVTTTVLRALAELGRAQPVLDPAVAWIVSQQSPDGGFGDSPSTAHDTANVLLALIRLDAIAGIDAGRALGYLENRQTESGSWEGSVYTTSLVVNALKTSLFSNWRFDAPIAADPASPRDGEKVTLTLEVTNDGNAPTPLGVLRLYEGDPGAGGTPVGGDVGVPVLNPGRRATVTALWDSFDKPGLTTLWAVLDPDAAVEELSETDNRAAIDVDVAPAPVEADLAVASGDVLVVPARPDTLPADLAFSVAVRNFGQTDAVGVRVVLWHGDPVSGTAVGETTLSVPQRSSSVANFVFTLSAAGSHLFTVEADADDVVVEADETNNETSVVVETGASVDLEVKGADIVMSGQPFLDQDLTFQVTLRNRGTLDAPQTEVRYSVSDGSTEIEVDRRNVVLEAGRETTHDVVWRVDLVGDLTFTAELDPGDLAPENDETNNVASREFTAAELLAGNLAVSFLDMTLAPDPAHEGSPLEIGMLVRNTGNVDASDVEVAFYDGDPSQGGTLVATEIEPLIAAGASSFVTAVWPAVPDAEDRLVFVVVDPNDTVAEVTEDDNSAFQNLAVLSLPDLAISTGSLALDPRFPGNGETVTLTVEVANLGEQAVADVVVRVWDGDPALGGVQVGGDRTIPFIAGLDGGQAVFSWTFAAGGGSRPLVVRLDPDDAIAERTASNNEARLEVVSQAGDFFVSSRYISPNGDGVKDTSTLFYRLAAPAATVLEIRDTRQRTVRRAALAATAEGQFEWDGLDDFGRVVRDGEYRFVMDLAGGGRVGQANVTVDTDHSSLLEAIGTPFELFNNVTCELPTPFDFQISDNEEYFFFDIIRDFDRIFDPGTYRMSPTGTDLELINPYVPGYLAVSPDGSEIFFDPYELYAVNSDGSDAHQVLYDTFPYFFWYTGDGQSVLASEDNVYDQIFTDGVTPSKRLWQAPPFGFADSFFTIRSPDRDRIVFPVYYDVDDQHRYHLVDAETGTTRALADTEFLFWQYPVISWSPDGELIAFAQEIEGRIPIFDKQGDLIRTIEIPLDPLATIPAYQGFDEVPLRQPWILEIRAPTFSSSGTELAFKVVFQEGSTFFDSNRYGAIFRADLLTGEVEAVAWLEPELRAFATYHVSTWDGTSWQERGSLSYGLHYRTQNLSLTDFLPDADGEYKVRIRQQGLEAAHVESVALRLDGRVREPSAAHRASTGEDVLARVRAADKEVLDAHESTVEVRWDPATPPRSRSVMLSLTAREESLRDRHAVPFTYPADAERFYSYRIDGQTAMRVDGLQTSHDALVEPLFREISRPDTGHPTAPVAGYVGSDDVYLYAALDFAVDNTEDADQDWAELQVLTAAGWRSFRVTASDSSRGTVGFTRTGLVGFTHKYYEIRVPLADIGVAEGDVIDLRFAAYGTAAMIEDGLEFPPLWGEYVLWVPNARGLVYLTEWDGDNWAIDLDEGNDAFPAFGDLDFSLDPHFTLSGRQLVFGNSTFVWDDPSNPCYLRGSFDYGTIRSLMNMTVELRPRRTSGSSGIELHGTAVDLNFSHYQLDYAAFATPDDWKPIAPPRTTPVFDELLLNWVPPGPGSYLVRLTGFDLAGNRLSALRRISWNESPSLTDLFLEPELFSPNGDGELDTTSIHYRVLRPLHLEVHFFNESGDRVRTVQRDHSLAAAFELVWDGRNDAGLPVADGVYRVLVQDYELFVTIDTEPPAVEAELLDAYRNSGGLVAVAPLVTWCISDPSLASTALETAEIGAFTWSELRSPLELCPLRTEREQPYNLSLEEYVGHRFRVQAADTAGNRAVVTTPVAAEQLIVERFGRTNAEIGPMLWNPMGDADGTQAFFLLEHGTVAIALAETIRTPLNEVYVQYRRLGDAFWQERRVELFSVPGAAASGSEIPDVRTSFLWDMDGVNVGVTHVVRIRAVDESNRDWFSNSFRVQTDGIELRGLVSEGDTNADVPVLIAQAGLDADDDLVLWGVEFVAEPLAEVELLLRSDKDPRFATWQPIEAAALVNGTFIFAPEGLVACTEYEGFVRVRTEALPDPETGFVRDRVLVSNARSFALPCITVAVVRRPIEFPECGAAPLSTLRSAEIEPTSLDGSVLQILTVAEVLADGSEDVVMNVNRPESGREYTFDFETLGRPEGIYELVARATNVHGEEARRGFAVVVDRTPPTLELTSPPTGEKLCGVPRSGLNVVDVRGRFDDNFGAGFKLSFALGDPRGPWQGTRHLPDDEAGGTADQYLGSVADVAGRVSLLLEVTDDGGFKVCTENWFLFDGEVEGAEAQISRFLFSPNGDALFDEATVSFSADEPFQVDVEVFRAARDSVGRLAVTGPRLRLLVADLAVDGGGNVSWLGDDDAGTGVADGLYGLVVSFRDACGNTSRREVYTEVDTTPPSTEILYPRTGDPLTVIMEVLGTAADRHLQGWTLDFGLGIDPTTWERLATEGVSRRDHVMAQWNTFGLEGFVTLRLTARDEVANARQVLEVLDLGRPVTLVTFLESLPRFFSPNGDGRRDRTTVRFGLDVDAQVTLKVLASNGVEVRRLFDGEVLRSGESTAPWDGLDAGGNARADGTYTLELTANLPANPAVEQTESVTVVHDTTPPSASFERPSGGFVQGRGAIVGAVGDPYLTSFTVSITEDPEAPVWTPLASGVESRSGEIFGDLEGFAEGEYALRVEAEDAAGNRLDQVTPFVVDNTPPELVIDVPADGGLVSGLAGPALVAGSIVEDYLLSYRLEYGRGEDPSGWQEIFRGDALPRVPELAAWNVQALADGLYTLRLTAEDQAGWSATASVRVTVDNTPPQAVILEPADGGSVIALTTITGTATDAHFVDYRLAVAPGGRSTASAWSELGRGVTPVVAGELLEWALLPADGLYTLRLTVSDGAGNETRTLSEVTVDLHPPSPPMLRGAVENGNDARLEWDPSPEADVAGYTVYRHGVRVNAALVTATGYLDAALPEAPYVYEVTAFDEAGNESAPSNAVELLIDVTPPAARILNPRADGVASGFVEIKGTAFSVGDFREYRLFAAPSGGANELLRRSPVPAQSEILAPWDTFPLPSGALYTLRLEAEDLNGNVAVDEIEVTIDNEPPAPPLGLIAVVNGTDVDLSWSASPEPDLLGYLLYRDGRLANARGAVLGNLRPFVLTITSYTDVGLPDGTFVYEVVAVDLADNMSDASLPADATIETRAPQAVVANPEDGAAFEEPQHVLCMAEDQDVDQVVIQWKAVADGVWTTLATDATPPWEITWDPAGLAYGDYQLRCVATDTSAKTDAAPAAVTVTYTDRTRPAPVTGLAARVDGGDVTLDWSANGEADLAGYHVERASAGGGTVRLTASPVAATSFVDTGVGDELYTYALIAVDGVGNEADPVTADALVYTPELVRPLAPTPALTIRLAGLVVAGVQVDVVINNVAGTAVLAPVVSDAAGFFEIASIALERGTNQITARATDAAGNHSKQAVLDVVSVTRPSPPTGFAAAVSGFDVDLTWNPNPAPEQVIGYRPFRDGAARLDDEVIRTFTSLTESSADGFFLRANRAVDGNLFSYWAPEPGPVAGQWWAASWADPRPIARVDVFWYDFFSTFTPAVDYDLEVWDGVGWAKAVEVRGNDQAVNGLELPWTYMTNGVRILIHTILLPEEQSRSLRLAEVEIRSVPLVASTSHLDTAPDGLHTYTVTAVNAYGLESGPSALLEVGVGDVVAPDPVILAGSVSGSDAALSWTASPAADLVRYDLFRDNLKIAEVTDLANRTYLDAGRPNGTYRYFVRAIDQVGNAGDRSNELDLTVAVAPPSAPVALSVSVPSVGATLDLAWQAGPGAAPAAYQVRRSIAAGGPYDDVATVGSTVHRDTGLDNGTTYYYVVEAMDALGNPSASSNEAQGTPVDSDAPQRPRLHHPGQPGRPFVTGSTRLPLLAGSAEPGTLVEVDLDGLRVGESEAFRDTLTEIFPLDLGHPSPDGQRMWIGDRIYAFETRTQVSVDAVAGQVRWFPSGDRVAVTFDDASTGTSRVVSYDLRDGSVAEIAELTFARVALPSPDGRRLLVLGERAGFAGLWVLELETGRWTPVVDVPVTNVNWVTLSWSPDSSRVQFNRLSPNRIEVVEVALPSFFPSRLYAGVGRGGGTPDPGALLVVDSLDATESLLDVPLPGAGLPGLAFTSDGELYATAIFGATGSGGGNHSNLLRLDPDTGALIVDLGPIVDAAGADLKISDLAAQPGTGRLYGIHKSGSFDGGAVYVIDKATAEAALVGESAIFGGGLAFAPDGTLYRTMAVGSPQRFFLETLDPTDASALATVEIDTLFIDGLAVRDDGVIFGSVGSSGIIRTIDPVSGRTFLVGETASNTTSDLAFRPVVSARLYASVGRGNSAQPGALLAVDPVTNTSTVVGVPELGPPRKGMPGLAFTSAGELYASTLHGFDSPGTLVRLDPDTGALIEEIGRFTTAVDPQLAMSDLAVQPGTDALFGVGWPVSGQGNLFRIDPATAVATSLGLLPSSAGLAFGADGTLYLCVFGPPIELWTLDPTDATPLTRTPMVRFYDGLAVRPSDGLLFATLGGSNETYLIEPSSGAERFLGTTAPNRTSDFAFRPDGTGAFLIFGGEAASTAAPLVPKLTFTRTVVTTHPGNRRLAQFSPDGDRLIYTEFDAGGSQQVRIFTVSTGQSVQLTSAGETHEYPVWSPDGEWVAYLVNNERVVLRHLASGEVEEHLVDFWATNLTWTRSGHLFVEADDQTVRFTPGGRFELRNLDLEIGDNTFTATAVDDSGNRGAASEAMVVRVVGGGLSDLAVTSAGVRVLPAVPLVGESASLSVTVRNVGFGASEPSAVDLVLTRPDGSRLQLGERTLGALAPGESETVVVDFTFTGQTGAYSLLAVADPFDLVEESDEANNQAMGDFVVLAQAGPALFVATDRGLYLSQEDVLIDVDLVNAGPEIDGRLDVIVEDTAGFLVEALPRIEVDQLAFGASSSHRLTWSTGDVFAGGYRVRATLADTAGVSVAEALAPFTIGGAVQLAAGVTTGEANYPRGAAVRIAGTVSYVAGNSVVRGAVARLRLMADTLVIAEWNESLGDLLAGSVSAVAVNWTSGAAQAATYGVGLDVLLGGEVVASAPTFFNLVPAPLQLEGALTLTPRSPPIGVGLEVGYSVTNGGLDDLLQLPVLVTVIDPDGARVLSSTRDVRGLSAFSSLDGSVPFPTDDLELKSYLVLLEVELDGAGGSTELVTLATAGFPTLDRTVPEVTVDRPVDSGFIGLDDPAFVTAFDALSRIDTVELEVDGVWRRADPDDLASGRWSSLLSDLAEGPHVLRARATDSWDNTATTEPVSFIADFTPPRITVTGVEDGVSYGAPVVPLIEIVEQYPDSEEVTLNATLFASGTTVGAEGNYLLRVLAVDLAGNRTIREVRFTLGAPAVPDLAAVKLDELADDADGDGVPSPGDELCYRITVSASGSGLLTGVELEDAVPALTRLVDGSVTTTLGNVAGTDPVRVLAGGLAAGESVEIGFCVVLEGPFPVGTSQLLNQGTASSDQLPAVLTDDPDLPGSADPTRTAVTYLPPPALIAAKEDFLAVDADGNAAASPGDVLEYVITVANNGLGAATGVVFRDTLPASLSIVPGSLTTSVGLILSSDPVEVSLGTLAPAGQAEIRFRAAIDPGLDTSVSAVVNQGAVASAELPDVLSDDPDVAGGADATVTALVFLLLEPVLWATKDDHWAHGDVLEYVLLVTNLGGATATGVVIYDEIPAGTSLVAGSLTTSAGVSASEDPVEVRLGQLAIGESIEVRFQVEIDPTAVDLTEIVNQGRVDSAEVQGVLTDDPDAPGVADPTVTRLVGALDIPTLGQGALALLALLLLGSGLSRLRRRRP